jgi:hypothetical protein
MSERNQLIWGILAGIALLALGIFFGIMWAGINLRPDPPPAETVETTSWRTHWETTTIQGKPEPCDCPEEPEDPPEKPEPPLPPTGGESPSHIPDTSQTGPRGSEDG